MEEKDQSCKQSLMSVHVVVFDADWGDAVKPLPADIIVIVINHSLCFFQLKEINRYFL